MRFLSFLRMTKTISRVLFFIWLFMIVINTFIEPESFLLILFACSVWLITPIVIIEVRKNPIIKELKERSKQKKLKAEIDILENVKRSVLEKQELERKRREKLDELENIINLPNSEKGYQQHEDFLNVEYDEMLFVDGMDGHDFEYFCADL